MILTARDNVTNDGVISAGDDAQLIASNPLNRDTISMGNERSLTAAQSILKAAATC